MRQAIFIMFWKSYILDIDICINAVLKNSKYYLCLVLCDECNTNNITLYHFNALLSM